MVGFREVSGSWKIMPTLVPRSLRFSFSGSLRQVLAVEDDRAGGDLAALGKQTHEGQGGHGLAGAGLAHDAQGFARVHVQVDAGEGADHAGADLNVGVEVLDVQEWSVA